MLYGSQRLVLETGLAILQVLSDPRTFPAALWCEAARVFPEVGVLQNGLSMRLSDAAKQLTSPLLVSR